MKLRLVGTAAAAGLVASALTGCSSVIENATPTPVDFKACLVTTAAGVNDGARNQLAYFALQQATVQFGSAMSIVQLKVDSADAVTRAGKKLVSRGCNLVFAIGSYATAGLLPLAQGNPNRYFRALDVGPGSGGLSGAPASNLWSTSLDIRTAYLQAGYLAAAASESGTVAIIAGSSDPEVVDQIWYFRQGVYQFSAKTGKLITILGADRAEPGNWQFISQDTPPGSLAVKTKALAAAGADVILPLGVNYLPVAQAAAQLGVKVIGADSDWAAQPRFAAVKSAILASVVKPIAENLLVETSNAMSLAGLDAPGDANQVASQIVALTPEADLAWPAGLAPTLNDLANDYAAGKLTVVEEPARY